MLKLAYILLKLHPFLVILAVILAILGLLLLKLPPILGK